MGRVGWLHAVLVILLLIAGCGNNPQKDEETLRRAVARHDPNIGQIKALIADGVDLDARDMTGKTALFEVAGTGNVEIARLLVAHGADINIADRWQITPLHEALRHRGAEMARFLINAGAEVTVQTYGGETPLHEAARMGDLEIVRLLVARGAEINATTGTGETPLLWGAREGQYEIAEFLIAKGADVNIHSGDTLTSPLHLAAEMGHERLVRLLLDSGASVDLKDRVGHTPAIRAMQQNHRNVVAILAEAGAEINLHLAAYLGDVATAQRLIETGSNVNVRDDLGYIPLHYAAQQGQAEVTGLLIDNGADVDAEDNDGNTPLHLANEAYRGHEEFSSTTGPTSTQKTKPGGRRCEKPCSTGTGISSISSSIRGHRSICTWSHTSDDSTKSKNSSPMEQTSMPGRVNLTLALRCIVRYKAGTLRLSNSSRIAAPTSKLKPTMGGRPCTKQRILVSRKSHKH